MKANNTKTNTITRRRTMMTTNMKVIAKKAKAANMIKTNTIVRRKMIKSGTKAIGPIQT